MTTYTPEQFDDTATFLIETGSVDNLVIADMLRQAASDARRLQALHDVNDRRYRIALRDVCDALDLLSAKAPQEPR